MKNNRLALLLIGILAIAILAGGAYIYSSKSTGGKPSSKKEKGKKSKRDKESSDETSTRIGSADCYGGSLNAVETWELPKELLEISGIAWLGRNKVAAIEDNLGTIFIYDLAAKKVAQKLNFGPGGDYEGIAQVNGYYFVVRSDGRLFEVSSSGKLIKEHRLPLTVTDNIETLHYDRKDNRLILGQKDGKKGAGERHFYSFDLGSKQMDRTPIFSISLTDPVVSCGETTGKKKGKKKGSAEIRPSELAIHPTTREIFIADGPSQRILVLSADARPKYYLSLDKKQFPQVEGLMFSPEGELYISTEGTKQPARISRMETVTK